MNHQAISCALASLGQAVPLPVANAASRLLDLLRPKTPVPAQLSVLPKQMMQLARR